MSKSKKKSKYLYFVVFVILLAISYLWNPSVEVSPSTSAPPTPIVAGVSTRVSTGDNWYELYFTNPVIPFDGVIVGGIENNLIEKINSAQNSIYLAVFELDLENVTQALIAAKNRGVEVKVVYDDEYTDPDPEMKMIEAAGVPVVPDNRTARMHNKFFVFDNQCVWTGSFNITENAAYRNHENAFYFCSPEAATNYTVEFNELFSVQFGVTSPADTPFPVFNVNGYMVENYFAPEDNVMNEIISEVQEANSTIHFYTLSFTHDGLGNAILEKLNSGVEVAGVFESRGADTQASECRRLLENNADVTLDGNPRTLHHKVIVIDGKTVIFGSFNFSDSADEGNDENTIIVHSPALAQSFEQEFQRLKAASRLPDGNTCKAK